MSTSAHARQGHDAEEASVPGQDDSVVTEQATGVLMQRYGLDSDEALAVLTRWSHEARVPLPELAHGIVQGGAQDRDDDRSPKASVVPRPRSEVAVATPPAPEATSTARQPARALANAAESAGGGVLRRWRYTSAVHAARAVCRI